MPSCRSLPPLSRAAISARPASPRATSAHDRDLDDDPHSQRIAHRERQEGRGPVLHPGERGDADRAETEDHEQDQARHEVAGER